MTTKSTSRSRRAIERAAGFVVASGASGHWKVLLLRHRDGGHWGFPKGRVESGEQALDAARREVMEETSLTGLLPMPGFRVTSRYQFERDGRRIDKTVTYYLADVDRMDVCLSDEHTECAWLDIETARRTLTYGETRRILGLAETYLVSEHPGS